MQKFKIKNYKIKTQAKLASFTKNTFIVIIYSYKY